MQMRSPGAADIPLARRATASSSARLKTLWKRGSGWQEVLGPLEEAAGFEVHPRALWAL